VNPLSFTLIIEAADASKSYVYLYQTTRSYNPGDSTTHTAATIPILIYRVSVGICKGKRPLGRPRRRWEKILKSIFEKMDGRAWTGLTWLRIGANGGLL
jgi:hypothetical protein